MTAWCDGSEACISDMKSSTFTSPGTGCIRSRYSKNHNIIDGDASVFRFRINDHTVTDL
jgi:hypothetical protein